MPQVPFAQRYLYVILYDEYHYNDHIFTYRLCICIGTVFLGIILSVLSSNIVDIDYSLESLHDVFIEPEPLIYTGVLFAILILPRFLISSGKDNSTARDEGSTASSIMDLSYRILSASILAMLFGTVLKVVAEGLTYGLSYGLDDVNKMKYDAIVWIILFVVFGFSKLRFISTSIQSYHPLLFLPIYQGLSAAMHTTAGIMYFQELSADKSRGAVNVTMYAVGMACVVLGLILFALNYDPNVHSLPNQEEYSEDKESLLNANLDSIYGPPGGKGRRYVDQGHSGEVRRGEMRYAPRQGGGGDDIYDEYTNPMMNQHRRPHPSMECRDEERSGRYDSGGRKDMRDDNRGNRGARMPPLQRDSRGRGMHVYACTQYCEP